MSAFSEDNPLDIDAINLFIHTAKAGSFAASARSRNIDPSSVSRTISALESELQIRLFQRSTRKLSLTEAGERYLQHVEPLVEGLVDAAEQARLMHSAPKGRLRVTASQSFGQDILLPLVNEFRQKYPQVYLDLQFTDSYLDLHENNIDIALRLTPALDSNLVGHKLFDTHYFVVASAEYMKQHPLPKSPKDLTAHECVIFDIPNFRSKWRFRNKHVNTDTTEDIQIRPGIGITSMLAIRQAALQGCGPALIVDWMIQPYLDSGELVNLFPNHHVTATDFDTAAWLLYPSRKYVPAKSRVMIDFLKEKLARN